MAGEAPNPTLTDDAPKRGRKRGPDLSVLVDTTVVGLFGLVAVATGHEHWLKERQDVVAITGPLNAWIDQLPAKTLKRVEKSLAPALFVVGLAVVVGPDAVLEAKLRARDKNARRAVSEQAVRSQPTYAYPPAGGVSGSPNGASEQPRGGADWYGSIPTGAPSGYSPDEG